MVTELTPSSGLPGRNAERSAGRSRKGLGSLQPARVLVIVTRQIGDVLLTTPLIHEARRLWPAARIDVLGFAKTLGMLAGNPDVHGFVEAPSGANRESALAFARRIWRAYDLALIAEHSDRAHGYGFLAAPVRVGVVPPLRRHAWWKRLLASHVVVNAGDRGNVHVVEEKLGLLAPWRGGASGIPKSSVVATPATPLPADLQGSLRDGFVVVHVPSLWTYKQWPIAGYGELIRALVAAGRQVVVTGSGSASDREKVEQVVAVVGSALVINAAGKLDFGQISALLEKAALYVGPDTSVTHLAAAVGTPTLALFGPTSPVRWGPVGRTSGTSAPWERRAADGQTRGNVVLLQGNQGCVPCGRAGCADHRQSQSDCLDTMAPERVIREALRLLVATPA